MSLLLHMMHCSAYVNTYVSMVGDGTERDWSGRDENPRDWAGRDENPRDRAGRDWQSKVGTGHGRDGIS